jgi:hypothetical protein
MRSLTSRHRLQGAARGVVAAMGVSTTLVMVAPLAAQQAPAGTRPVAPPTVTQAAPPTSTQAATTQAATTQAVARRDTSSLPFHDDQWGMDFGISSGSVYRIGVVRFTSPTRAWILDGRISGGIDRQERWADDDTSTAGPFPPEDVISQGGSFSLLVGRRAYRAMGTRAMRTVSFGIGGGFGYGEYLQDGARQSRTLSWNATSELAVGGHYRVTPSLALGATLRLGATYARSQNDANTTGWHQRQQHVDVGLGTSDLVLSLFF